MCMGVRDDEVVSTGLKVLAEEVCALSYLTPIRLGQTVHMQDVQYRAITSARLQDVRYISPHDLPNNRLRAPCWRTVGVVWMPFR